MGTSQYFKFHYNKGSSQWAIQGKKYKEVELQADQLLQGRGDQEQVRLRPYQLLQGRGHCQQVKQKKQVGLRPGQLLQGRETKNKWDFGLVSYYKAGNTANKSNFGLVSYFNAGETTTK